MPVVPALPTASVLTGGGPRRLLNQPLTIERRSAITTDEFNNEVAGAESTVTTTGYVEQTTATEITVDRETYVTDWLVVLFADVQVDASDHILYAGGTLKVVGKPHRVWNPRLRRYSQTECRCVEVAG